MTSAVEKQGAEGNTARENCFVRPGRRNFDKARPDCVLDQRQGESNRPYQITHRSDLALSFSQMHCLSSYTPASFLSQEQRGGGLRPAVTMRTTQARYGDQGPYSVDVNVKIITRTRVRFALVVPSDTRYVFFAQIQLVPSISLPRRSDHGHFFDTTWVRPRSGRDGESVTKQGFAVNPYARSLS